MKVTDQTLESIIFFSSLVAGIYTSIVLYIAYKKGISSKLPKIQLIIWLPAISIISLPFLLLSDLSITSKAIGFILAITVAFVWNKSIKSIGNSVGEFFKAARISKEKPDTRKRDKKETVKRP